MSESKIVRECKKAAALSSHWNGGSGATPYALAAEMVAKIPEDIIKNPESKFLDPCAGVGTFGAALLERLVEYHSEEFIINEMIHMVEISALKVILLKKIGFKNVEKADSLDKDWNMKFDVIIGNPPFNSNDTARTDLETAHRGQGENMAKAFTMFALSMDPQQLLFVQPYGHRTFSSGVKRKYIDAGLVKVTDCTSYFPTVKQTLVYFNFDTNSTEEFTNDLDIKNVLPEKSIADHFVNQPGKLSRFEYEKDLIDEGEVKVFVTTGVVKYTNDENFHLKMQDKSYGHWRVVFNCTTTKTTIGKVLIASPTDVLSKSVHCLKVESEEQAKRYQKYLKLESTEKLLGEVKRGMCNSRKFLQYIPDID